MALEMEDRIGRLRMAKEKAAFMGRETLCHLVEDQKSVQMQMQTEMQMQHEATKRGSASGSGKEEMGGDATNGR